MPEATLESSEVGVLLSPRDRVIKSSEVGVLLSPRDQVIKSSEVDVLSSLRNQVITSSHIWVNSHGNWNEKNLKLRLAETSEH
jgi:hypothetical protein